MGVNHLTYKVTMIILHSFSYRNSRICVYESVSECVCLWCMRVCKCVSVCVRFVCVFVCSVRCVV